MSEDIGNGDVAVEISELESKIIKQIEYYFGDINLGKDKFMLAKIKENDGWIPLETMVTFNRLKSLSEEFSVITDALKKSTSGIMEVDEEGKRIRRSVDKPLPEFNQERRSDLIHRSVYGKGFSPDAKLDFLQEFFGKYGKVEHIQMRRTAKKEFKGSCFVVYDTVDSAKKYMEAEEVKVGDNELIRFYKEEYFKKKTAEKKVKKDEDAKDKEEDKQKREENEREEFLKRITKGSVLELTKIAEGTTREMIKEMLEEHGKVTIAWVEFEQGDKEARVRFTEADSAQTVWDKTKESGDGKVVINDSELEGRVLEGEEEELFWKNLFRVQREKRDNRKKGGRGQRGFKSQNWRRRQERGNRGGEQDMDAGEEAKSRKREAATDDTPDEPAQKVAKTEDTPAEPAQKVARTDDEPAQKVAKTEDE